MREVSIFLLDEHKNKILEFLERWYFKNKRKLDTKEIGFVANLFQIHPQDVERLQEAFLRQKKLNNLRSLNQYLADKKGKMPLYMTSLLKGKNEYNEVVPKYNEPVVSYEPTILNKYKSKYGANKLAKTNLAKTKDEQDPLEKTQKSAMLNKSKNIKG